MYVTADSFFASVMILMGLFSFTFVFFPQTECRTGKTSAGLMENNILIRPLLMVVGFGEIKKQKKQQKYVFSGQLITR